MSSELLNYDRDVLINTIELVNFMCHDHLIIKFNKKFTCIGGRNGSGKSAIMISLGILFGLRSANLDRGKSLKNLIKTGETFFIVRCVLNNSKKFMYETFGDWIILEKKVSLKTSTFTVTNKDKKTIFNRMEDLEYLMDFYDLKFDNPLNFLTQEMAKRFLSSSDTRVLYQLFLKGTEIADIRTINEDYKSNVSIMKDQIQVIENEMDSLNLRITNESRRMEILNNLDNLNLQIENCKNEIEWSGINKIKLEADKLHKEIEGMIKEVKRKQDAITEILEASQALKLEKQDLQNNNKNLQEKNRLRLGEIENEISSKEKKMRSIEHDLQSLEKNLNYKLDLIRKFELSNTFVDRRKELFEEKTRLEGKISNIKNDLTDVKYTVEQKEKEANKEKEECKSYDKKLYTVRKQIDYLSKNDQAFKIHSRIDEIKKEVQATKFKDDVYGPIGDFIKLKEQKWAKVVSIVTQKILTNFICFNQHDRDKLHAIFKKYDVQFSVQMPSSRMDKIIDYRSSDSFKSLLDVISVGSTVVLNQLIIMLSIERLVLIEDRAKAYSVMRQGPQHVDCVYLPNGDVIKRVGGSLSDFSSRKLDKYFFENATDKVKALQRELSELVSNKPSMACTEEYERLKKRMADLSLEKDEVLRKLSHNEREIENAESLYTTQKEMISNENVYEEKNLYEKQIASLRKRIEKTKNEIEMLTAEQKEIKSVVYKSVADFDKQLIEKQAKLNRINQETNMLIAKKLEVERIYKEKLCEYEKHREVLLTKLEEVENPRDEKIVAEEIQRLCEEVKEIHKIGSVKESKAILDNLISAMKDKENFLGLYKSKTEDLYQAYLTRVNKREDLKEFISREASSKFREITSLRGYHGELSFDHQNETLELKMKVHNLGIAGAKETLSGGERSFAAMSLLLSLWPHVSCPVKILDEFDVFMDNLNRKFVIQKFKDHFLKANNQVILITPLNTNDLVDDEIHIVSLKSPERKEL